MQHRLLNKLAHQTLSPSAIVLLAAALLLGGCAAKKDHVDPPAPLKEFTASVTTQDVWSHGMGSADRNAQLSLTPWVGRIASGSVVVATDARGQVIAFDSRTGEQRWRTDLGFAVAGGVGGGGEMVVITGLRGEVAALDLANGALLWKSDIGSTANAPAAVGPQSVALRTADGRLVVLNSSNGERLWSDARPVPPLSLQGTSQPILMQDAVLAGFDNGDFTAYELGSGRRLFNVNVALPSGRNDVERMVDVDSSPLFDRGTIYALAYQGRLIAIDAATAQVIWATKMSGFSNITLDSQAIYLTDADSHLVAIDRRTGRTLWSQDALHARGVSAPLLIDGQLVVGDKQGYVHWFAAEDGRLLARSRPASSAIPRAPVSDGERVFIQARDGRVVAMTSK
ncbi:MAG: outer membrane protein assembly factor BamB [Halothiobacillaceae bacterium]